jgi:hypothetical protein
MNLTLENIKKILDEKTVESEITSLSTEDFEQKLLVFLNLDHKNRPRTLEITLQNQDIVPENYCTLQFVNIFPVSAKNYTVADTARAISFINKNIVLPGFEYDEIEGSLSFRYLLLTDTNNNITANYILGIIGNIMMSLDLFGEFLDNIATGEITFNEAIEKSLEIIEKI